MTPYSTRVADRIAQLSDDAALEAINLLAGSILGAEADEQVLNGVSAAAETDAEQVVAVLEEAEPSEAAALARLVLVASVHADHASEVESALDAVGRKAVLLEIAVIGILALGILHTVFTRGSKKHTKESTITTKPDGTVTVHTVEQTENFSVGAAIAPLAAKLIGSGS